MSRSMFSLLKPTRSELDIKQEDSPFYSLQNEINRLFDNFFRSDFQGLSLFPSTSYEQQWITPAIDIIDDEKNFKVEVELLPGMDEKDIELTITPHYLTIKGEKKLSQEDKEKKYHTRERCYGSLHRVVAIPEGANYEGAKATFKDGVLWIELPKKEESLAPSKKLNIQVVE